jgi:MFS family permease
MTNPPSHALLARQQEGAQAAPGAGAGWFLTSAFFASALLGVFDFVLPMFGQALGASPTAVGVLFSTFSATAIVARLVLQWGLDRWPRRLVYLLGLLCYIVAMLTFASAGSVGQLVAARLIQGLASTATWLTASVLLASQSPEGERGAAFGWFQVVCTWGAGVGATWTLGAVALLEAGARAEVDARLASWGLAPLAWPWPPLDELAVLRLIFYGYAFALGLAVLAALRMASEIRPAAAARVPWRRPRLSALGVQLAAFPGTRLLAIGALRGAALGLTLPVLILYLHDRFAAGLGAVVLAAVVPGSVYALAPGPLGRLADRAGYGRCAFWATLASVGAFVALPLAPSLWVLALIWVLEALSFSLAAPALNALLARAAPPEAFGAAFGRYAIAAALGGALTPALGGWLYENAAPAAPFLACAALLLVSGLLLLPPRGSGATEDGWSA